MEIILNDLYYIENGDYYFVNNDYEYLYKNSELELEIVGIVREKEAVNDNSLFYYNRELVDYILNKNKDSKIVLDQIEKDYSVLGIDMNKYDLLSYLGYETLPKGIDIYVSNLDDKSIVVDKLNKYNNENDKLIYIDTMNSAIDILKSVIKIITVILFIFSLISIMVSSLMIFILTNNRVMERVKEIGILRSLGARNKDIIRLFNIENIIIGIISSIIGMIFLVGLNKPINYLLSLFMDETGMFKIYVDLVIIVLIFNIIIVVLSGYIPSFIASRKRIVDCINNRF